MTYKRRGKRPIQSSSLKIHIICEGPSEVSHLEEVLREYKHVSIRSIDGGGYLKFCNYIDRNKDLYSTIFVVADLDKAQTKDIQSDRSYKDKAGLKHLNRLIKKLHDESKYNTIFLTGPEIEYWVACCIGNPGLTEDELYARGYEKGEKVQSFIRQQGGSHNKGCECISNNNLYYKKAYPGANYTLDGDNLNNKQSNLPELMGYVRQLQDIWLSQNRSN